MEESARKRGGSVKIDRDSQEPHSAGGAFLHVRAALLRA
ncbi:hypothetical protein SAMN05421642_13715 [Rhodococcoides kyotonense]|uniref:Uncharacterized protein n=1 Tax=Rhodococcoides kyotonense TaxID=398843 RepID=A0A239NE25_9NOCA|nr:hypothetical protein SAMN05421642_13715 [Rhodococcus kyotonensis]